MLFCGAPSYAQCSWFHIFWSRVTFFFSLMLKIWFYSWEIDLFFFLIWLTTFCYSAFVSIKWFFLKLLLLFFSNFISLDLLLRPLLCPFSGCFEEKPSVFRGKLFFASEKYIVLITWILFRNRPGLGAFYNVSSFYFRWIILTFSFLVTTTS